MKKLLKPVDGGERYELRCPKAMPQASTFLWNRNMLLQLNCRGFAVAQHMQPEPSKYSHAPLLEHKTFMQPEQPQYAHHPGRFAYIRDRETGSVFSAPHEPVRAEPDDFVFSAGRSDAQWRLRKNDIGIRMSVALPLDDVAELWTIEVHNDSGKPRRLDLFPCFSIGYMSWMNQSAAYSSELGGIVARSITPYQKLEDYPHIKTLKDWTVLLHGERPSAWEACRDVFEGEGGIQHPDGVENGGLHNGDAIYETPIAALQYRLNLAPGECREYRFVFAPVRNGEQAKVLRTTYLASGGFEAAQAEVKAFQEQRQGCISISTPDAELDNFVNHWLNRQVFYHGDTNRLTTDPQTRNYLQDAMGMAYIEPGHSRAAILQTLAQQKADGALPEGVVLSNGSELKYINQVPHTDHCVWLPITLQTYLDETGDYALLDEWVESHGESLSVLERVTRAMRWLINNSDHRGLSLIAQGDWCDPLNMVGHQGKGVSGWLTIATVHALTIWADITKAVRLENLSVEMRTAAEKFTAAAQQHLWDGDWFARGISDAGTALGVSSDEEGKIWLNPQSWALMSGVATPQQQEKIKAAVREHLETPFGPMVLAPSYTSMREHIGRVTQKHPGTGENGAVYNHAGMFCIYALYAIADSDRAFTELRRIIPGPGDEHCLQRGQLPVFIPNYYRGAVKQFPRTAGRSSQLFNTGACSWLYRIIVEQLFGLRGIVDDGGAGGTAGGLQVAPQLPAHWQRADVTRHFRGATFDIQMQRDDSVDKTTLTVGDKVVTDGIIRDIEAGKCYSVKVLLPGALSSESGAHSSGSGAFSSESRALSPESKAFSAEVGTPDVAPGDSK
ncbi:NdvB protein [Exilibacterium tricleocarpae]|uniref:NdvB protein n=1 Tax=Exilibacterium tricleocarpae TaxID=2591008 RepID=A0A545TLW7_9GAMM|nr:NdvB protein [Exilibacterium tricleocarpae]TQV78184.1 NdvB protein [Exilibacterium tricleocarpae]